MPEFCVTTTLTEPARSIPVAHEADLCVVGGGCTGVFAAIRAARLGLRVALVEQRTLFGGNAAAAWVTHWHSTYDTAAEHKIIGGLLDEVVAGLRRDDAIAEFEPSQKTQYKFSPAMMACQLDEMVRGEKNIRPFLQAHGVAAVMRDAQTIDAAVIEDKSGRRAIRAAYFIDASGDGDLLRHAAFDAEQHQPMQPWSYQALFSGLDRMIARTGEPDIHRAIVELGEKYDFPVENNPWIDPLPPGPDLHNVFGSRIAGLDASDGDQLTASYLEGRRLARAYLRMIRESFGEDAADVGLAAVAPGLGVRETWHARCLHRLTRDEVLSGVAFDDAIAQGTYPVDVHDAEGVRLMYLDGRQRIKPHGSPPRWSRWRDEASPTPPAYQIPYRCLVPRRSRNLLVAGRLTDADREAYGAIRVMVNCNQLGEAAGVACALARDAGLDVASVPPAELRDALKAGGSALP